MLSLHPLMQFRMQKLQQCNEIFLRTSVFQRQRRTRIVVCCSQDERSAGKVARVLILGATGRIGGSTARALASTAPAVEIVLAGRNRKKGEALAAELGLDTQFAEFDYGNAPALESALDGIDLVVHAAGPFQRLNNCAVLEAAIRTKTCYIDVCDDGDYSLLAKSLHKDAMAANVAAITTCGIYPGVSNIMAAELVRINQSGASGSQPERLRFSYYTAGSGGAGPTILATSFLLLGEEVVTYQKGKLVKEKAYSGRRYIDFGKGVGKKPVFLLNLPEIHTAHSVLGVPNVSARFGTDPSVWNFAMAAFAKHIPQELLRDRNKMALLAQLLDPLVRIVDAYIGEKVSMRVDLDCMNGCKAVGLYTHKKLTVSAGVSVAAFARAVLEGSTKPGVWFPEEDGGIAVENRQKLLTRAAQGTSNYEMNRPQWMIEKGPKELGFGIYLD